MYEEAIPGGSPPNPFIYQRFGNVKPNLCRRYDFCLGVPFSIKLITVVVEVGIFRVITLSRISSLLYIVNSPMRRRTLRIGLPNAPKSVCAGGYIVS